MAIPTLVARGNFGKQFSLRGLGGFKARLYKLLEIIKIPTIMTRYDEIKDKKKLEKTNTNVTNYDTTKKDTDSAQSVKQGNESSSEQLRKSKAEGKKITKP